MSDDSDIFSRYGEVGPDHIPASGPAGLGIEPIPFDEYQAAYKRFIACLSESGIEYEEVGLDEQRTFNYRVRQDPDWAGTPDTDCYFKEFFEADRRWQAYANADKSVLEFERAVSLLEEYGAEITVALRVSQNTGAALHLGRALFGQRFVDEFLDGCA